MLENLTKLKNKKECPLFYNLVYPRYFSDTVDFRFIPECVFELSDDGIIDINRESELYWQLSKFNKDCLVVSKINNICGFVSYDDSFILNIDYLLDDSDCFIRLSCGTWIGNTNYKERVTDMKPVKIEDKTYTLSIKRIWGFEPDLVENPEDITTGIIDGFSKKKYNVFVLKNDNDEEEYIPTLFGKLMTSSQIEEIISSKDHYPSGQPDKLFVAD